MPKKRLFIVWAVVLVATSEILAQQKVERSDPQRPDLPPPYYYYPRGAETTAHRSLTVEEAIAAALAHASAYGQAQLDEAAAREEVKQANAAFFPEITAPIAYYGNTPSLDHRFGEPLVPSFAPSNGINKTNAFLNAGGTVDIAGRLEASLRRSRELLAAAHAGTQLTQRQLVFATVDAYYGLALARQRRRLADETLALAESFLQVTQELVKKSQAEASELSRARAEALRRRDELEQARVAESAASDVLHAVTGIDPSVHLGVSRPTPDVPPLGEFDSFPETVIESRPQLLQIDATRRASEADIAAARAERHPQLTYNLNAGFDATDVHRIRKFSGGAALIGVTIPIFNFGASRSREAEARLRSKSLDLLRDTTRRQLQQEFYTARATAFAALERIKISQQRATDAEKNLKDLMARYRQRKATITELLDAQSAHADSRAALYQAITDYQTARVRLATDPAHLSFPPPEVSQRAAISCTKTVDESPAIFGFRLGMNLASVRSRFPALSISTEDASGATIAESSGSELHLDKVDDPAFSLSHLLMKFDRERLYFIRFVFSGETVWETKDSFLTAASARFHLPGPWKAFYDWSERRLEDEEDLRDLAVECQGFRIRLGVGFFSEGVKRIVTPHIKIEDTTISASVKARQAEHSPNVKPDVSKTK